MHAKTALAVAGSVLAVPSPPWPPPPDYGCPPSIGQADPRPGAERSARAEDVRLSRRLDRKPHVRQLRTLRGATSASATTGSARASPASKARRLAGVQAIAACESGGNPWTDTGNGFYGKYQFTQETWQAIGGTGNPAAAPEAEQDRRAAQLYAQAGPSQWPVCGR